jgi:DNA polymerase I-like protein with 3'-5' exonuclease and polymerase domains
VNSWLRDAAVIDFEALPIRNRPTYPPAPVGVALDVPGRRARYLAWGHPTGRNNSTWEEARREVGDLQASGRPLLYHNAKFDVEVQTTHLDLPLPPWEQVHDTLPMLFLQDPRAPDYQLKPSAERLLGEAPEERDDLIDWLVEHQPVPEVKLVPTRTKSRSKKVKTTTYAGAYVALAPPSVAGPYAIGDVRLTKFIARHAYPYIEKMGMVGAYDLERALLPTLLAMEKRGVRVDLKRLGKDIDLYQRALVKLAAWIRQRLGVKEDFNLNSPKLGEALVKAQVADPTKLGRNSKGYEVNKDALERGVTDPQMLAALRYYGSMTSYLSNPLTPWYEQASVTGGLIYTTWHSTRRSHDGGGLAGARTGRLSCTPNLMNLRKKVEQHFRSRRDKSLPLAPVKLPPLPVIRQYIVPHDEGEVLFGRDFNGQEPRVFAHFEDGPLCQRFNEEPETDLHQEVADQVSAFGYPIPRKKAKIINLATMYSMGIGTLAERLGCSIGEAKSIRKAYFECFPSIRSLSDEARNRFRQKAFIRTFAGRVYYAEQGKLVNGRWQDFAYKALNILIQGSSADLTKLAMRDFDRVARAKLLISVHDEIVCSAPKEIWREEMDLLRSVMNLPRLDVPILSEGYKGFNWAEIESCA